MAAISITSCKDAAASERKNDEALILIITFKWSFFRDKKTLKFV